jgi:hypothetical protein
MPYFQIDTDDPLRQKKRRESEDRLTRETRIGWPALIAMVALVILMLALFLSMTLGK